MDWIIVVAFGILLSMVISIICLLSSLAKQGDERREFIKAKTATNTFTVIVGFLLIEFGYSIYVVAQGQEKTKDMDAFSMLVVISVLYFINLLLNKRKYGA